MPFVLPYLFFFGEKQKGQRFHKIKYIEQKQKENCKKKVLKEPDFTAFMLLQTSFSSCGISFFGKIWFYSVTNKNTDKTVQQRGGQRL